MQQERVTIRFTSLTKLWEYRLAINANIFEMNLNRLTITCYCTEEHIQLAISEFNGKVVEYTKEDVPNKEYQRKD
jgi:hypothetical protein